MTDPMHLLQAVTYGGKPINESQVILEFLEDGAPTLVLLAGHGTYRLIKAPPAAYPDRQPSLRPKDPYLAAQMRLGVDVRMHSLHA